MRYLFTLCLLVLGCELYAQQASDKQVLMDAIAKRNELKEASLLKNYPVRNIGPVVQGARIVDLAVNEDNPKEFYLAFASGGVFKTTNNGISFQPVFDHVGALGIGDIALAPSNPQIVYVGTGENNSSRSSYAGSGVYRSDDGGKSWRHLGLEGIQHTGRIVVHPGNPDVAWVAAMGALYSHNADRGLYKTTDGGKTWKNTLFINDSTGIIDLIIHPTDPNILWAAAWERTRKAWDFKGNGPHSAIYRSTDGGETWTKAMNGMPTGDVNGRIGLDVHKANPSILYALVDNQAETRTERKIERKGNELLAQDFKEMSKESFLSLDNSRLGKFLSDNNFPKKYSAASVKEDVRQGKYDPTALYQYLGGANEALFNTKIAGAELYRSEDGGLSWRKVSQDLEGLYFTYGYYFGEVRVNPQDADEVFLMGVPMVVSRDGGKTFQRTDTIGNVHVDHHSMWINPKDPQHIINGNDGGLNVTYDGGKEWLHINNVSGGQFYTINVDMETPYNVYGGLQDNGSMVGPSTARPEDKNAWQSLMGGDGMYVAVDPRNSNTLYVGYQFGNHFRMDRAKGRNQYITPTHELGDDKNRFNWRTPVILSKHNPEILYMTSQRVYRSLNQGDTWESISPDLTKNGPQGNVPYHTIASFAESPLKFGLLYAGTDDGKIHISRNGGSSWEIISKNLPANMWVSSIYPSTFQEGTVFVSLTGYRWDDFSTYIFRSDDYGNTWKSLKGNLPDEPVNVIIQDLKNKDLLFVGTDHGTYASLDAGATWHYFSQIPNVASYDMIIHPRENELVVATHGRSVYVSDIKPLQQVKKDTQLKLFAKEDIRHSPRWGQGGNAFSSPRMPSSSFFFYSNLNQPIRAELKAADNTVLRTWQIEGDSGFHTLDWDLKVNVPSKSKKEAAKEQFVEKGKYTLILSSGNQKDEVSFEVK